MLKTFKKCTLQDILPIFLLILAFLPNSWSHNYFPIWRENNRNNNSVIYLVRSTNGLSTVFFSGEDLYDNTMESLQWLVPTDIRRYNIFSPQSTFQINMRYRNDPSVKRYYKHQLWKIHETDVTNKDLNQFWKLFG